jgi:hypothetical protein
LYIFGKEFTKADFVFVANVLKSAVLETEPFGTK